MIKKYLVNFDSIYDENPEGKSLVEVVALKDHKKEVEGLYAQYQERSTKVLAMTVEKLKMENQTVELKAALKKVINWIDEAEYDDHQTYATVRECKNETGLRGDDLAEELKKLLKEVEE